MGYYDSIVASYDNQININNKAISECNRKIQQLEDDVEDLERVKARVGDVDSAVKIAEENTSKKIMYLPSIVTNPFSILKTNFFSDFLDVIKGSEHNKAMSSIESANSKIDAKIRDLQREIEGLKSQIGQCNSNIRTLTFRRSNYIAEATAPKNEVETAEKSEG